MFRNAVLKVLDYLPTQFFTKWWTSAHPCLWLTEPFGDIPLIPNHDKHLFPINVFTCGMFKTNVLLTFLKFPSLLPPLSQLFWNMLQASNSKWVKICETTIKFINLNIKNLVFVVYWIEYRLKRFANNCILFLFTQHPNVIGIGVVLYFQVCFNKSLKPFSISIRKF